MMGPLLVPIFIRRVVRCSRKGIGEAKRVLRFLNDFATDENGSQ